MKFKALVGTGIAAGALAVSSMAGAAVTFDPATGTGFAGKGDVQLALGWNNKQLQDNVGTVSFRLVESTVKTQDCVERVQGTIISRREDVTRSTDVAAAVAYDARTNKKADVTGFFLNGLGASTETKTGGCLPGEQPQGSATETTTTELRAESGTRSGVIWTPSA